MFGSLLGRDNWNRWKHFTAMALIGDGVLGLIRPGRDAQSWAGGPLAWKAVMRGLSNRPTLTRAIAAAQIAGAVYWVLSHEEAKKN